MSKYFKRSEFACKCGCGFDSLDYEVYAVIVDVREFFGRRVHITSACRCEWWNGHEGGTRFSLHPDGKAIDFVVEDIHEDIVVEYLEEKYPDKYGIGRYTGRTHVDTRSERVRWDNR